MNNYNFEIYTKNPETLEIGWDIEIVDVVADNKKEAKQLLRNWRLFDCIILFNYETNSVDPIEKGIYINCEPINY